MLRSHTVIRRAFDVGSGSIKCLVAEVDTSTSQICRELYARTMPVPFLGCSDGGRQIPDSAQEDGLAAIATMMRDTAHIAVDASAGIATQVFRISGNGAAAIDRLSNHTGIPITVVEPSYEGALSHLSAVGLSSSAAPLPDSAGRSGDLVAWDCGAGSFQFTSAAASHSDRHGSGTVHAASIELLQAGTYSRQALLDELSNSLHRQLVPKPDWLAALDARIVAVGSAQSIFNQQRVLGGAGSFTQSDVEATLSEVVAMEPAELFMAEQDRGPPFNNAMLYQ